MAGAGRGTDRAVSKVLGNVLMVAIVVILSALIGPFAYDLATQTTASPPNSVFEFQEREGGGVIIAYEQGPTLDTDKLRLEGEDPDDAVSFGPWPTDGTISSGERINLTAADGDETYRIIWSAGTDRAFILSEHEF